MRQFLLKIFKFSAVSILLQAIILFGIIILNRINLQKCAIPDEITALVAGDSHTMWSINDTEIPDVLNVSFNAEGYIYTYAKLRHILSEKNNIIKIYLGFSYHNLSGYYNDYIYGNMSKFYFDRYIGVLTLSQFFEIIENNPGIVAKYIQLICTKGALALLKQECPIYHGFPSDKMLQSYDSTVMENRIYSQFYDNNGFVIHKSEINIKYFVKIVELCKLQNIELILVDTPIHKDYRDKIPNEYKKMYADIIKEYKTEIFTFPNIQIPDTCFLPDGDHVNFFGSFNVTQKFKEFHESTN